MNARRLCLPVSEWPELDLRSWEAGMAPTPLFELAGAAAQWSKVSRQKAAHGYGRWLRWLHDGGLLDQQQAPHERVYRQRVADYRTHLAAINAPYTVVNRLEELYNALRVIEPTVTWTWLSKAATNLRLRAEPVTDKRACLRTPQDLTCLGEELMAAAAATSGWSEQRRAVQYRDGLIIAMLAYRPVRMRNLASMQLGTNLVEKNGCYWLSFGDTETKTAHPYDAMIPEALVPSLRRYLTHYRAALLKGEGLSVAPSIKAVWVSEMGTQLEQGAMAARIRKHTKKAFGTAMTPHRFRDAVATAIAIYNPVYIDDARSMLGHASLRTTEKHYNQAKSLDASRRYNQVIEAARVAGRGKPT